MQGIKSEKAFDLTSEMIETAQAVAKSLSVSPSLSDKDQLLGYLVNTANAGSPKHAIERYIIDGRHHASQFVELASKLNLPGSPPKVLEFASGFGRITRHIVQLAPAMNLVSSDIHGDACAFIERELGITARVSSLDPLALDIGDQYDLIFVVSLFSHLPKHSFGNWLKALYDRLSVGGYLMFTTHGQGAFNKNPAFWGSLLSADEPGYGFNSGTDQKDIDSAEYGTTIALPRFVMKVIAERIPEAHLVRFTDSEWFSIQDEWVVRKPG